MTNRTFLIIIGVLLGLSANIGFIGSGSLNMGFWTAQWLGTILLIRNGTFYKTKYKWAVALFVLAFFFGVHLMGFRISAGEAFVVAGAAGILLLYSRHFFKKAGKGILDVLKYVWILSYGALGYFVLLQHAAPVMVVYIPALIIWVTILLFAISCFRNKELMEV